MLETISGRTNSGIFRPRVLLTGASGVVGQALLKRLINADITCLAHRATIDNANCGTVFGDISKPDLGLSAADHADLLGRLDAVINCAAVTDFHKVDGSLEATNVAGTANVAAFARAANATLYHVSTAFRDAQAMGERGAQAVSYAASKRSGEQAVSSSGARHVILRPSIVIGDSLTGQVAKFQGLHQVAGAIASDLVPMIPFNGLWALDFVPSDYVADAIATVVEQRVTEGEFWLTAGDRALRLEQAVEICLRSARSFGAQISQPRFVPPELFDRLIGPVFLEALPRRTQITVLRLLEFFTIYLAAGRQLPCSAVELSQLGVSRIARPAHSLAASLEYWAAESGFADRQLTREVA